MVIFFLTTLSIPLFRKPRLSSCCAGSTSNKIDAEDGFSSREDEEDMTSIHMTMLGESYGDQVGQRGCPKHEGGPKLIWFESPRWRPKSSSSPSRVLDQSIIKLVTRARPGSVFDDPRMDGKII